MNRPKHRKFQGRGGSTGTCGKCGTTIEKGMTYVSVRKGFRGPKLVRCASSACSFRVSEYTTSKLADVYAASEAGHDAIDALADLESFSEDAQAILSEVAENWRAVAEEYRESAEMMGEGLGQSSNDRADTIDSAADELDSADPEVEDEEEEDDAEDRLDRAKQEAHDIIDGAESNIE